MSLTYGEMRTEVQKLYDEAVMERVKKGIAFLEEKHGPDWVDKIDLKTLELSDGSQCVLGQVYAQEAQAAQDELDESGYVYALYTHEEELGDDEGSAYGFTIDYESWSALQAAWEDALTPMVSSKD